MAVKTFIKLGEYHDSVSLMLAARELSRMPGVVDAAVVMATEANKQILQAAGLLTAEAQTASPNDLVIAVSASEAVLEGAMAQADRLLSTRSKESEGGEYRPKTLAAALKSNPGVNVAVISVAGRYAAAEAWAALYKGLHVLLFSDNVSLEDEIALKQFASQHGLLLMGPGAGTAILNGVALGFANVLPAGPVGIVSAAGTGLQEVSTLLARYGIGITQGIGTGGRDLKEEVGGLMMLASLKALQADPATKVIVLVSKPPALSVARKVLAQAAVGGKPVVACFLGGDFGELDIAPSIQLAHTLEEAAWLAASQIMPGRLVRAFQPVELIDQALNQGNRLGRDQRCLRGLFSGGTLCYEAQVIWRDVFPEPVFSNAPFDPACQLADSTRSQGHTAVDLGEEEFTVGRPHPMIDNDLRIRRLLQEANDPEVALILLDVVLGYGAHPDPALELAPAIQKARSIAAQAGRDLLFLASVTGTEADPQSLSRQKRLLQEAGVVVCDSNAAAAYLAAALVKAS